MSRVARVAAIALRGLEGFLVTVEGAATRQLPGMGIVGLPDTALNEAKQRVRHAAAACGFYLTERFVLINLQPADLPKHGSGFDLAIALAALGALEKLHAESTESVIHIGELGLDGEVLRPRGLLAAVAAAARLGVRKVMVPLSAAREAALVPGIDVIGVESLIGAVNWHQKKAGGWHEGSWRESHEWGSGSGANYEEDANDADSTGELDISDIVGQQSAVEALQIAAVGRHHMHMLGPPGAGKTMLAARLPTILPDLLDAEAVTASSMATLISSTPVKDLMRRPPFESPHHTASAPAIVGTAQGGVVRPGAISLASYGVLFLDEAQEFSAAVLDSLRQPLETGKIDIHRAAIKTSLPARVQLVLASNPCPCGNGGSVKTAHLCTCSSQQLRRYASKISGPLLDRVDLKLFVDRVARINENQTGTTGTSLEMRARVLEARRATRSRLRGTPWGLNSEVSGTFLRSAKMHPGRRATAVLDRALEIGNITLRGYDRTLRLAWSISDLKGVTVPTREEIAFALTLREGEK